MRLIGLEIKAASREPATRGLDKTLDKFERRRINWPLALAGVAGVCLVVAVFFPVFAQSKVAAKKTQELFLAKRPASAEDGAASMGGDKADIGANTRDFDGSAPVAGLPAAPKPLEKRYNDAGRPEQQPAKASWRDRSPAAERGATDKTTQPPVVVPGNRGRDVVKDATISVRVDNAGRALKDAMDFAAGVGGYAEASGLSRSGAQPTATVTLRVPSKSFEATMSALRGLGTVDTENITGEDVTAQVADMGARVKTLAAEEQSLIEMLRGARTLGQILAIRDRLTSTRQELESIKAQLASLKDLSSMSTINATFQEKEKAGEPAPPEDWQGQTWAGAVNALQAVGRFLAQVGTVLFVLAPVWLPLAVLSWWLWKRSKSKGV